MLIELDGVRLLTDPVLRTRLAHLRRVSAAANVGTLSRLDAVLLSHLHYDHLDLPSLLRLGRTVRVVVPRGGGPLLRRQGFSNVAEIERGDELAVGAVVVTATHAEHEGKRGLPWGAEAPAVGYVVTGSAKAYFAGDTDLFDGMHALGPGLDVALLPVAGWGSRLPAGHLDPLRAARAASLLRPRVAVPIHWGTFRQIGPRLDAARLREPADEFARLAAEHAPAVEVRVLPPGGSFELPASPALASSGAGNGALT